jgi:hypothetical protein
MQKPIHPRCIEGGRSGSWPTLTTGSTKMIREGNLTSQEGDELLRIDSPLTQLGTSNSVGYHLVCDQSRKEPVPAD